MRRSPLLHQAALVPLWMLQLVVMFGIIGFQVYLGTTKGFGGYVITSSMIAKHKGHS